METPSEFAERFFASWMEDGTAAVLARMVESRDAEIRRDALAEVRELASDLGETRDEMERQNRIDETARAVFVDLLMHEVRCALAEHANRDYDQLRPDEIKSASAWAHKVATVHEAERERRLKK